MSGDPSPVSGGPAPTPRGVSKIRHDLRDRLSAVQGYGEILLEWRELPGRSHWLPSLQAFNQSTVQLLQQLNQTLEWSRVEAGLADLVALQNSIRTLCQMAQAIAENLCREAGPSNEVVLRMVERYAGSAKKFLALSEQFLSSFSMSEDWQGVPPELFLPATDETRLLTKDKAGTILVADDSEENRDLLRHRLEWQDYTVHMVDSGRAVLDFVNHQAVDLILMDMMMPGLDGLETLKLLKASSATNSIPVIMLSSTDALPVIIRSLQLGADDFLPKPFNPILLAARVEASLAKRRLREKEKSFYEQMLSFHLGRGRSKQILENPDLLRPGAVQQEISFLFTDITNFSRISDRMAPDRLFRLLNQYYEEAIQCIHEHEGTVVHLTGDAIFAIWNAPEPQPEHQLLACRTALALRDRLDKFNAATTGFPLMTRFGLHCGESCVGNLGSRERFGYTALGANTNVASRLEGLNKYLGTDILASDSIITAVENAGFLSRSVGHFRFKGCDRVVEVFELYGSSADGGTRDEWMIEFSRALSFFKRKQFTFARTALRRVLELQPGEGSAKFYLKQIDEISDEVLSADWMGEINLEDK